MLMLIFVLFGSALVFVLVLGVFLVSATLMFVLGVLLVVLVEMGSLKNCTTAVMET